MQNSIDPKQNEIAGSDEAANVIRAKIDALYDNEPDAKQEAQDSVDAVVSGEKRSKHQQYMYELSTSGKSLADIQTAWHNYYVGLPDKEKHEVWQEFYEEHGKKKTEGPVSETPPNHHTPKPQKNAEETEANERSVADVKNDIIRRAFKDSKIAKNHHVRSLVFGFGMGSIVVLIILFGFFNERFVAPFITHLVEASVRHQ